MIRAFAAAGRNSKNAAEVRCSRDFFSNRKPWRETNCKMRSRVWIFTALCDGWKNFNASRVAIAAPVLSLLDRQRKQAVLLRWRAHRCAKATKDASSAASCPVHATPRPSFVRSGGIHRVALFDVDSRIPNLALMKLSAYNKARGCEVVLARKPVRIEADKYFASTVFFRASSRKRIDALQALYGERIDIGGSGTHLGKRLPAQAEMCFPDYGLYSHSSYAMGFLTRGCRRRGLGRIFGSATATIAKFAARCQDGFSPAMLRPRALATRATYCKNAGPERYSRS